MIALWSPKGGSGTSVLAAALALRLGRSGPARLADLAGDQPALLAVPRVPGHGLGEWLGMASETTPEALARLGVGVTPELSLLPLGASLESVDAGAVDGQRLAETLAEGPPTVVDAGMAVHPAVCALVEVAPVSLMVIRPCYLALRRAVAHPLTPTTDGAVVVEERGHPLTARDVADVLGLPVVARVPTGSEVIRAVDAGTIAARLPGVLDRAAAALLQRLGPHAWGEAA